MTRWTSITRLFLPACLGTVLACEASAQWSFGPAVGIDVGSNPNITASIGYARPTMIHGRIGETGYSLGAGIGLDDTRRITPQIGFWWNGLLAIGCKAAVYTHSDQTALVVIPEVGVGWRGVRLVWGFPLRVGGPDVEGINRSQFSVYYFYPIKQEEWDR
jgi:hypothetical protein